LIEDRERSIRAGTAGDTMRKSDFAGDDLLINLRESVNPICAELVSV